MQNSKVERGKNKKTKNLALLRFSPFNVIASRQTCRDNLNEGAKQSKKRLKERLLRSFNYVPSTSLMSRNDARSGNFMPPSPQPSPSKGEGERCRRSLKFFSHSLFQSCADRITRFATAQRFPLSRFTFHLSRSKAFTLAEVLITLGIIGIVAMMTIPNLIEKVDESAWHQAWRKDFSVISQAYMQFKADNGGSLDEYFTRGNFVGFPDPFVDKFVTYFKTTQTCLMTTDYSLHACGNNAYLSFYKALDATPLPEWNFANGNFILVDGTQIYIRTYQGGFF